MLLAGSELKTEIYPSERLISFAKWRWSQKHFTYGKPWCQRHKSGRNSANCSCWFVWQKDI